MKSCCSRGCLTLIINYKEMSAENPEYLWVVLELPDYHIKLYPTAPKLLPTGGSLPIVWSFQCFVLHFFVCFASHLVSWFPTVLYSDLLISLFCTIQN